MSTPATTPTVQRLQALLDGPAGTPPAGVTPKFEDPQNLNAFLTLTLTLTLTFGTLAVLMRIYTKLFIIRSIACEDCRFTPSFMIATILTLPRRGHDRMGKS